MKKQKQNIIHQFNWVLKDSNKKIQHHYYKFYFIRVFHIINKANHKQIAYNS